MEARWDGAPEQGFFKKKGGWGFPYCAVMTADGDVFWEARPANEDLWKKSLRGARRLLELKAALKEKPDDKVLKANYALLNALGCSQRKPGSFDELEAHSKVEGVDPKLLAEFKPWFVNKKFDDAFSKAFRGGPRNELGARMLALYNEGVRPPQGHRGAGGFFYYAADGAIDAKDLETARNAFAEFEKAVSANPRFKGALDRLKKKLAKAEGGAEGGEDP